MQTLPPMSADERAHHQQLVAHIREAIQQNDGWLDFERYMELALYAPGLGYYTAGAHKLGAGGDFTTAPEISALFSRCVANQCLQVLRTMSHGAVLELGAGSGAMAAEMLLHFEQAGVLPQHYFILDISADLRARQRQLLQTRAPHLLHRVSWLDTLPTQFSGVIVGNEVVDALPIQRFVIHQGQPHALGVTWRDDSLNIALRPANPALRLVVNTLEQQRGSTFAEGYCSEVNRQLPAWMQALSAALTSGVILLIDYGLPQSEYYSAERNRGTLTCFYKHLQHEDALLNAGLQDLTAWVNFTALAEAGIAAGLELRGYATQAHFLLGSGLEQLLNATAELSDAARWQQSQQVQKLIMPGGMGESFKAMAFSRDCDVALSGFAFRDLRDRL